MAAVLKQMARDEFDGRGHELMIDWGRHRRGGDRTRSPVASVGWDERLDPVHEDEPPFVVEIDDILRGLTRAGYGASVEVAKVFYLEHPKYAVWQVAKKVCLTEGFVRLTIRGICGLVDRKIVE